MAESTNCTGATNLIAVYPILYGGKLYKVGDKLPTHDADTVNDWLEAKTAVWKEDSKSYVKTESASAQAGITGTTESNEEVLPGKVPAKKSRKK